MQHVYKCEYCNFMGDGHDVSEHEQNCLYNPENKGCANCVYGMEEGYVISWGSQNYRNFSCRYNESTTSVSIKLTNGTPCEHYKQGKCGKVIPL